MEFLKCFFETVLRLKLVYSTFRLSLLLFIIYIIKDFCILKRGLKNGEVTWS